MQQTLKQPKLTRPHCGKEFYLPSDCKEHVKVAHLNFGQNLHGQGSSRVDVLLELKEAPTE